MSIIHHSLNKIRKFRYDQKLNKEALKSLKEIEKNTNYKLSNHQISTIKEYSKEVLGSTAYSYWLYVYTAFNQEFKEGWIPDNYFGYIVAPRINKNVGEIANVKTLSKKIINTDLFPDRFYLIDNILYDTEFNIINSDKIKQKLFEDGNEYFLKLDNSNQGKGIVKITKENFNLQTLYSFQGDAVIQDSIKQADWFNEIITGSVATIRITTVKDLYGNINNHGAFLRVGRKGQQYIKAGKGIRIPIIDNEGALADYGIGSEWRRHTKHPDTGFVFSGQKIPYFAKAVNKCIELHKKIPHFSIIAWDVSTTNDGEIKIMEWNAKHPGVNIIEASIGPCFKGLGWEELWKS